MNRIFPPGDMFGRISVAPLEAVREATVVCLDGGETVELFRAQLDEEEGRGTLAKGRQRIVLLDEAELTRWARWPDEFPSSPSVANLT